MKEKKNGQAIRKNSILLLLLYLYYHHPTTVSVGLSYPAYYLAMNPHPLNHQPQIRTFIIPRQTRSVSSVPSHQKGQLSRQKRQCLGTSPSGRNAIPRQDPPAVI
ncbi:hypothetical protein H0G86_006194 [Trichoderma simmonsii]|uniref:Uncharacterized protein n=1 Tax=Trichoderma simmonsii TaxID=1491479 RepID=A0A8G0PDU3_9HYPO|nr:hypothetical protein H0G86_006194 [Trichoderma simmonsii]